MAHANMSFKMQKLADSRSSLREQTRFDNFEDIGYSTLFASFMGNTGMHGFPNIANSKSIFRKIIWTILLLGGFGYMVYNVYGLVIKYNSHPTQVDQSIRMSTPTKMPTITFCNVNPVKMTKYEKKMPDLNSNSSNMHSEDKIVSQLEGMASNTKQTFGWTDVDTKSPPPQKTMGYKFLDSFYSYNASQQQDMGYQFNDMVVECTYGDSYCTPEFFVPIINPTYGNCYVFNVNGTITTEHSGASSALGMSFYIDQVSYVPDITASASIRLLIHEPSEVPLPEDFGVSMDPGSLTQIGLRKRVIYKTTPPFGSCVNYSKEAAEYRNAYMHTLPQLPQLNYTQKACFKTCVQNLTIEECNCTNPRLPVGPNPAIPYTKPMCMTADSDIRQCMETAAREGARYCGPGSPQGCKEECVSTYYQMTMSRSQWPSDKQVNPFISRIMTRNRDLSMALSKLKRQSDLKDFVRDNFVRVEIYFEDLNYHVIDITPGYLIGDLLADMGGQVGLWLGLSVLTVFEIVELLFDIVFMLVYKKQTSLLKQNILKMQAKEKEANINPTASTEVLQKKKAIELHRINAAWT